MTRLEAMPTIFSPKRALALLMTTCGILSCAGGAGEDSATLAAAAPYTRVKVVADEGRIRVTLVSTHKGCLKVGATATVGGMPMVVEEHGRQTTGTGSSVGEFTSTCIPPSFVLSRVDGAPELRGPVDLVITDPSSKYTLRLTDGLTRRAFTVTDPPDGKLHVGKSATISIPIGQATVISDSGPDETKLTCATFDGKSLFEVRSPPLNPDAGVLTLDKGTFTFDVPATETPQPVQIGLTWHHGLAIESCVGPMSCDAREDHYGGPRLPGTGFAAEIYAGVAPLTIAP